MSDRELLILGIGVALGGVGAIIGAVLAVLWH